MRGGLGLFAPELDERDCDLGGMEELGALIARNGANEDAVGGADDEVADAFVTDEHGHGVAVGLAWVFAPHPPSVFSTPLPGQWRPKSAKVQGIHR